MATCAASTPHAGTCRSPRSPMARTRSAGWCAVNTPMAPTGSRPRMPAATSAPATIPRVRPGSTTRWRPSAPPRGCLGMPVAVHTGAAQACKQAIRCGARSLEHAYLIDEEAVDMATSGGVYIVPTMQMTQEDLDELRAGTLPCQAVWKFSRDNQRSSTPNGSWPPATSSWPSGPTAACSRSATASASSRRWSTPD